MTTHEFFMSAWPWRPVVTGVCLAALLAYGKAAGFRLSTRGGYFIAAVVIFELTLASPVSALADGYLFSAHMLQHLLLLLVVPALVLLGLPERKGPGGIRLHPFVSWLAGSSAMWVWHERTLCDAAAAAPAARAVQTISLIAMGLLFWLPIQGPRRDRRLPPLLGVAYLFSACVSCTVLGILITFAPVGVVCPAYLHPMDRLGILPMIRNNWGFTPEVDQKVGGLMMWVPACGIYLSGVIGLLVRWYRTAEATSSAPEPAPPLPSPRAARGNAS